MTALGGDGSKGLADLDQTGNAKPGSRADHRDRPVRNSLTAAELKHVALIQSWDCQSLRHEIVDRDQPPNAQRPLGFPKRKDPGAVGKGDAIGLDRPGDNQDSTIDGSSPQIELRSVDNARKILGLQCLLIA